MKFYLIIPLMANIFLTKGQADVEYDEYIEWEDFKRIHKKSYTEENKRREIWSQNIQQIAKLNLKRRLSIGLGEGEQSDEIGFSLKMNQYGDLTNQEFNFLLNGFKVPKEFEKEEFNQNLKNELFYTSSEILPISVDWRENGYVTEVRDQGMCGCCYIFAAVATLEGHYAKQYGKLMRISEQNFLDCTKSGYFVDYKGIVEPMQYNIITSFGYSANGCNGGNSDSVFQFVKFNGFITAAKKPYIGKPGICTQKANYKYLTSATITGFKHVYPHHNETALTNAIAANGPIAVGIHANLQSFQFYSNGIYNDPSCTSANINHAVTVVGYGTLGPGQDYYIIKNSWGTSWGMKGYGYIARNKGNMCGIASYASYPLL